MATPRVTGCFVYPLKSARGVSLDALTITRDGPVDDRRWMLVHDGGANAGRFISQRDRGCEKLATFGANPDGKGGLILTHDGDTLHVPPAEQGEQREVRVWSDGCTGHDCGNDAARWLSDKLGLPCRLVGVAGDRLRTVDAKYADADDSVAYADGFPVLVTSTASLDALNGAIAPEHRVDMARFRPNIVIDGWQPFEEDTVLRLRVGEVELELVKPCSRCKITTIDQQTGVAPSNEPLATLARTRRGSADGLQGVFFGQNAVVRRGGIIKRGDSVEILSRRPLHAALKAAPLTFKPR